MTIDTFPFVRFKKFLETCHDFGHGKPDWLAAKFLACNVLTRQKLPIFLATTWFDTKSCQYFTFSLPKWWQVFCLYFGLPKLWHSKILVANQSGLECQFLDMN